jgi:hypothetical protein
MKIAKQKMSKKNYPNTVILILSVFVISLTLFVNYSTKYKQDREVLKEECINKDLGISLELPAKDWTCHNDNGYFYVEPPWIETRPNMGAHRQFTIWIDKMNTNLVGVENDWRFCAPNEYSLINQKCLMSLFYSRNDFKIYKYIDQKVVGLGTTTSYIGFFDGFLKIQLNPSSGNEYQLSKEDIANFDKLFDSIERI